MPGVRGEGAAEFVGGEERGRRLEGVGIAATVGHSRVRTARCTRLAAGPRSRARPSRQIWMGGIDTRASETGGTVARDREKGRVNGQMTLDRDFRFSPKFAKHRNSTAMIAHRLSSVESQTREGGRPGIDLERPGIRNLDLE